MLSLALQIEKDVIRTTTCYNVYQFSNYRWNSGVYYVHPHKEISSPVSSQQQKLPSGWAKCFAVSRLLLLSCLECFKKYSSYYHTIIIFIFSVEGWNFNLVLTCGWNRCCRWHCKLKRCNLKIQGEFSNYDRNSGFLICSTSHRIPTLVSNSKKLSG